MKKIMLIIISTFILFTGGALFACGGSYNSCGEVVEYESYSCNSCGNTNNSCSYNNDCECADPSCGWVWENNCISRSTCCEAFGNIGAH